MAPNMALPPPSTQLSTAKQSAFLLQQDKAYLSGQVSQLTHKLSHGEERLQEITVELSTAKQAKEDLYRQLIKTRYVGGSGIYHVTPYLVSCDG